MKNFKVIIAIFILLTTIDSARAQTNLIDAKLRSETIESILKLIETNYALPKMGERIVADIREREKKGEYATFADGDKLARKLTADMQSTSHDLHLRLRYSAQILPTESESGEPPKDWLEKEHRQLMRENFGLAKVDILKGNVGLIQFDYFASPENYAAALNYVANTDALIIDLRNNRGSQDGNSIPFVCSYFFEEPVHLNDFYWRPNGEYRQSWTQKQVPGKKYLDKPIYVLTSNKTFSGGEEFAYDLKNLKRATIIGDTTGGGAHPGGTTRINDHFSLWLPLGRAENPITKTDWEGTGVTPDVPVQATKALITAYLDALNHNLKTSADEEWSGELKTIINDTQQKYRSFKMTAFTLKGYTDAKQVYVTGAFNFWSPRINKMTKTGDGWTANIELEPGQYAYQFVVDDVKTPDPKNPKSIVIVE